MRKIENNELNLSWPVRFAVSCVSAVILFTSPCVRAAGVLPANLVWIGSANGGDGVSVYQELNWDADGSARSPYSAPPSNSINPHAPINRILVITSGTPGGSVGAKPHLVLGESGHLSLSGGTLRMAAWESAGIHADGILGGARSSMMIGGAASLLTQFIADQNVSVSGTANLVFFGGANPINQSALDFASDWTGSVTFRNEFPSDVVREHLAKFSIDGRRPVIGRDPAVLENGDNLLVVSDGGAGAVLTVIPEPGSLAMLGCGLAMFLCRRRQTQRRTFDPL